jgi:prepilin-type N-terminal cleavage/methylation domain-containing protein
VKNRIKDNSGYSLVELIIVLGIIAVLSGVSMISISAISTSRATSAKEKFDQEIATLESKTKSQDGDSAIMLKKDGDTYYIYYGTCAPDSDGTTYSAGNFKADSTTADVKLDKVTIYYTPDGGTESELTTSQVIKVKKSDGKVVLGSGKYKFCKRGSTNSVGTVTINKATGSHYTGN